MAFVAATHCANLYFLIKNDTPHKSYCKSLYQSSETDCKSYLVNNNKLR